MPTSDAAAGLHLLATRQPHYQTLRAYERGEQPWLFASDKLREVYEALVRKYRLNVCRPVVRGVGRRLNIDAFEGDPAATDWWATDGKRIQNRLWRESLRQGDGYTLTWPAGTMERGPLRTHRLRADEASVVYSAEDPDRPLYAVKTWLIDAGEGDDRLLRVNVYYPDRVERFVTVRPWDDLATKLGDLDPADLQPYNGDGAGDTIPYRGPLQTAGTDGILPVQHFACQPDDTPYGTSVLADVLPVQDEINHLARTLLVALEAYGLPLRIFSAVAPETESHLVTDPDTGVEEWVTSTDLPDYHPLKDWALYLPGENSRPWQLPEADLTKLLEVRRAAIQNATLTSGVPLGLLAEDSGNVPSGVALRVVESPLTDLVVDLQQDYDVPMRNVARLHGWDAAPSWSSPITMDDTEKVTYALQLTELGLPAPKAAEVAGLMDADQFVEAVDQYRSAEASVGERLMQAARNGLDPAELLR
jgi:hypothetical protein